jgi:hypothetical protein
MGVEGFEEYLETKTIAVPVDYPARLEAVGVLQSADRVFGAGHAIQRPRLSAL